MTNINGFTILEILVVLGISVIVGTVSFLSLANFRQNQSLDSASKSIVAFLRDAQSKSIGQDGGLEWGVRFENSANGRDSYYLVRGPAFTGVQSTAFLPSSAEFSDPTQGTMKEIIFSKITGLPASPATIIFRLASNPSVEKNININAQGTISEE